MAEKVAVYGGDIRNLYIADFMRKNGYEVRVCFHDETACSDYGFTDTEVNPGLSDADLIVLGLPAVKNDMTINCPFSTEKPSFENLLKQTKKSTIIAGGRFSQSAGVMAENYKIKLADYSTDEVFQTEKTGCVLDEGHTHSHGGKQHQLVEQGVGDHTVFFKRGKQIQCTQPKAVNGQIGPGTEAGVHPFFVFLYNVPEQQLQYPAQHAAHKKQGCQGQEDAHKNSSIFCVFSCFTTENDPSQHYFSVLQILQFVHILLRFSFVSPDKMPEILRKKGTIPCSAKETRVGSTSRYCPFATAGSPTPGWNGFLPIWYSADQGNRPIAGVRFLKPRESDFSPNWDCVPEKAVL